MQSYDYYFENESNVANCVAGASAVLAKNGFSSSLKSRIHKSQQFGFVYGWSEDGTEIAEIKCDRENRLSMLGYAIYTDKRENQIISKWKLLKDSVW